MKAAEAKFDVLITTDKNLRYQQDLAKYRLSIVLLPTNQVPLVEKLIPSIDAALDAAHSGEFIEVRLGSG